MKKSRIVCLASLLGLGFIWIPYISQIGAWTSSDVATERVDVIAMLSVDDVSDRITVHASGRGNPWINLRDGRDIPTVYAGVNSLRQSLQQNLGRPLALAAGDFDEDGVPDLVSGYIGSSGGLLALHRGNVDAMYPNSPGARQRQRTSEFTDAPFLSPARVFAVPEAPELLGTGDFDNDGHWDVVATAIGSRVLYWLAGDGQGGLGQAQRVELPGRVTAMVTGEINRADGLTDIVVAVTGPDGPRLLVFESPEGALRGKPEVFALPQEATALALGQLDEDYAIDLAVAAGNQLLIVHGRDRKLSLDETSQAEVPPAVIDRYSFPFTITSMAVGNFTGGPAEELALLSADGTIHLLEKATRWELASGHKFPISVLSKAYGPQSKISSAQIMRARTSSLPKDDLVVIDRANHQLHILTENLGSQTVALDDRRFAPDFQTVTLDVEGEPVAVLPMRLNGDALNDLVILKGSQERGQSTLTVVLTAPAATFTVNSTGDAGDCDPSDGVCSTRDPSTGRCTGPCTLRAAIEQANASPGAHVINFASGINTIRPVLEYPLITRAVTIDGTANGRVELDGSNARGSTQYSPIGLHISAGNSVVRGLVINRFRTGIRLTGDGNNSVVEGNLVGTDVTGTRALGNETGVRIDAQSSNNRIGGTTPTARNVISGNSSQVFIEGFQIFPRRNQVQGNFIGTDITGAYALGGGTGVGIINNNSNEIGGTTAGTRNIISGHRGAGISILIIVAQGGNLIQGNFIGTDVTGTVALGNGGGVSLLNGDYTTIGGTAVMARNIISGNSRYGIDSRADGTTNMGINGNFIGTDITGTTALGNGSGGILITGDGNGGDAIGGLTAGARNVISGNGGPGISMNGFAIRVLGNFIGTEITGMVALGNRGDGVQSILAGSFGRNTIQGNVISGNGGNGITITGIIGASHTVLDNAIGTDALGTVNLGNTGDGIRIRISNNLIGNTIGAGNTIAFNGGNGVVIASGGRNAITANSIFSNTGLGIDLGDDGVTPIHPCGTDQGPNRLQNYPELTSATSSDGSTIIEGMLDSMPNITFTLEFFANTDCNPSGYGEGERFLGSGTVRTDTSCRASFTFTFPNMVPAGQFITATATDPGDNTSEFSECIEVDK